MFIYHIVKPEDWTAVQGQTWYSAASLETEGFIHCSYDGQLDQVLKRYYSGAEKVLILKLDTEKLRSKLVEEASTNNEIYPHLYGRLNLDAVSDATERFPATEQ